ARRPGRWSSGAGSGCGSAGTPASRLLRRSRVEDGPEANEEDNAAECAEDRTHERRDRAVRPRVASPAQGEEAATQEGQADQHQGEEVVVEHDQRATGEERRIRRAGEVARGLSLHEPPDQEAADARQGPDDAPDETPPALSPRAHAREPLERKIGCTTRPLHAGYLRSLRPFTRGPRSGPRGASPSGLAPGLSRRPPPAPDPSSPCRSGGATARRGGGSAPRAASGSAWGRSSRSGASRSPRRSPRSRSRADTSCRRTRPARPPLV